MKNLNNLKYKDDYLFWISYKDRKCKKWNTIYQRLRRGEPIEKAIRPEKNTTRKILNHAQECIKCGIIKINSDFSVDKTACNGRMNKCKECMKIIKLEYRKNKKVNESENKYKSDFRKTEVGKLRTKLDNLFYCDKQVKQNRKLTKDLKNGVNKAEWLIYTKGIDIEKVNFAYGIDFKHTITSSDRF